MKRTFKPEEPFCLFIIILLCMLIPACGQTSGHAEATTVHAGRSTDTTPQGSRDASPVVLTPEAAGTVVYENEAASIDASNTQEGYIMVLYKGHSSKVKLQITTPKNIKYTYTLHGSQYETFPLTGSAGTYKLGVYEHVSGDQYSTALSQTIEVSEIDEFKPYLYPNQYVSFTADSRAVSLGSRLAEGAASDLDVVTGVYNYIIGNIAYDDKKAESALNGTLNGYLPSADDTLDSGKGICFDYAAVMAAMLRSQRIPTRLEVGNANTPTGVVYHAWVSTYLRDIGWVNGIIHFDGKSWELMDPTFGASNDEDSLKDFIGDGSHYITKYVY